MRRAVDVLDQVEAGQAKSTGESRLSVASLALHVLMSDHGKRKSGCCVAINCFRGRDVISLLMAMEVGRMEQLRDCRTRRPLIGCISPQRFRLPRLGLAPLS